MSELIVKQIDEKGRITLGKEFAGRQVQINEAATGIELRYVVTVPLEDAWLWENPEALAAVQEAAGAGAAHLWGAGAPGGKGAAAAGAGGAP